MSDAPALPALRQELSILPAPPGDDGAPRWFLFDPVRNMFHSLSETALALLSVWKAEPPQNCLERLHQIHPDMDVGPEDVADMAEFLYTQKLTRDPPSADSHALAQQEAASRPPLYQQIIHKYLYFRIPLFRPEAFLQRSAFLVRPFFKPLTWAFIAMIGIIGLFFAGRQWDEFVSTFLHFFTFEGFVFYGLTLIIIKALHELGHAFTAHHFGTRVPVIGVAFLVMFPVLYTDTTDAWRLPSRRQRLLIDGGGMMVELGIACLSIFLWSFLPEGPARSAAFFAATTSWILSLLVNLNPCMRFDGYYLLSDLFKVPNLQKQGFDMGRWVMRETLFGLGAKPPQMTTLRGRFGLCLYAYTTWIYRFFLFIGIALLVRHIFPKAIGIVLFAIEIIWFILLPIWREMKNWWSFRMTIIHTSRGRLTLTCTLLALALFCLPWQRHIDAPALVRPALQTEIYPQAAAHIARIHVSNGQYVEIGAPLVTLSSDALLHEKAQSEKRLALLEAQIARRAAGLEDRRKGVTLEEARNKELTTLNGTQALLDALVITAPHAGKITELPITLHEGRDVKVTDRLLRLVASTETEIVAFPPETSAHRIRTGQSLKFIADDPLLPTLTAPLQFKSPTSETQITEPLVTSIYGGALAVNPQDDGTLTPPRPVFKVKGIIETPLTDIRADMREYRGKVKIRVSGESPAQALLRSVSRVLIRETDF